MDFLAMISSYFRDGGPFMFIILAVGVFILAIVLERMWVVGRAGAVNTRKLNRDLVLAVQQSNLAGAQRIAKSVKAPVGQVADAIISTPATSEAALHNAADASATIVLPPLTRRLSYLAMLANAATLLGLLGTIFGLTMAFSAVGAADPSQRSVFLAAGISQALNTTSFGLIIALPALIAHGFLTSKVERITDQVDEVTVRLTHAMLSLSRDTAAPGRQAQMHEKPQPVAAIAA